MKKRKLDDKGELYSLKWRQMKRFARANIKERELRDWTVALINDVPRLIFELPATRGGEAPPQFKRPGGLINHLLATAKTAHHFALNVAPLNSTLQDVCLTAGLLHDIFLFGKKGDRREEQPEHPLWLGEVFGKGEPPVLVEHVLGAARFHEGGEGPIESRMRNPSLAALIVHLADRATMQPWLQIDMKKLLGGEEKK